MFFFLMAFCFFKFRHYFGQTVLRYLQVFAAFHEVLDIIDDGEVQTENLKEIGLLLRQVRIGKNFDQVSKVVAAAKHKQLR